jgi:hypothetical protein
MSRTARSGTRRRSVTTGCWSPPPRVRARPRSARTPTATCTRRRPPCCTRSLAITRSWTATSGWPSLRRSPYGVNGFRLTVTNDQAYTLVMRVADGSLDDIAPIAQALGAGVRPRA